MAPLPLYSPPPACAYCQTLVREGKQQVLFQTLQRRSLPPWPLIKPDSRASLMLKEAANAGATLGAMDLLHCTNCIEMLLASMAQDLRLSAAEATRIFTNDLSRLAEVVLGRRKQEEEEDTAEYTGGLSGEDTGDNRGDRGDNRGDRGDNRGDNRGDRIEEPVQVRLQRTRKWLKRLLQEKHKEHLGKLMVNQHWAIRPVLTLLQVCLVSACSTVATQAAVLLTKVVICCLKGSGGGKMAELLMQWMDRRHFLRTMVASMQLHSGTATPLCFSVSYVFIGRYKSLFLRLLPKASWSKAGMIAAAHAILTSKAFQHRKVKVETIRSCCLPVLCKVSLEQLQSDLKGHTRRWSAFSSNPIEQCTCGTAALNALALLHHIWITFPSEAHPLSAPIIHAFSLAAKQPAIPIAISAIAGITAMLRHSILSASDTLTQPLQTACVDLLVQAAERKVNNTAASFMFLSMVELLNSDIYRNLDVNVLVPAVVEAVQCRSVTAEETLLLQAAVAHKGLRVKAAMVMADLMAKCVMIPSEAPQLLQPQASLLCTILCGERFGMQAAVVAYRLRCVRLGLTMVVKMEDEIRARRKGKNRRSAGEGYSETAREKGQRTRREAEEKQQRLYQQMAVVWAVKRMIIFQCERFPPETCEESAQLWQALHDANTACLEIAGNTLGNKGLLHIMDNYHQGLPSEDLSFAMVQEIMAEDFVIEHVNRNRQQRSSKEQLRLPAAPSFSTRGSDMNQDERPEVVLPLIKHCGISSDHSDRGFYENEDAFDDDEGPQSGSRLVPLQACSTRTLRMAEGFPVVEEVKEEPGCVAIRRGRNRDMGRTRSIAEEIEMEEVARLEEVKRIKARFDKTVHQLYLSNRNKWLQQKEAIRIAHLHEQAILTPYCEALNVDPKSLDESSPSLSKAALFRAKEQRVEAKLCALEMAHLRKNDESLDDNDQPSPSFKHIVDEAVEVTRPYRKALRNSFEAFARMEREADSTFHESAGRDQEMSLREFNLLLRAFGLGSVLSQPKAVSKHVQARMNYGDFLLALLAMSTSASSSRSSPIAQWRELLERLAQTAHRSRALSSKHWPAQRYARQLRRYKVAAFCLDLLDEILTSALDICLKLPLSPTPASPKPIARAISPPVPQAQVQPQLSAYSLWYRKIKNSASRIHGPLPSSADACARVLWRITQPHALSPQRLADCLQKQVAHYQQKARAMADRPASPSALQRRKLRRIKKLYDAERGRRLEESAELRRALEEQLAEQKAAKLKEERKREALRKKRQQAVKDKVARHADKREKEKEEERRKEEEMRVERRRENEKKVKKRTEKLVSMHEALRTLKQKKSEDALKTKQKEARKVFKRIEQMCPSKQRKEVLKAVIWQPDMWIPIKEEFPALARLNRPRSFHNAWSQLCRERKGEIHEEAFIQLCLGRKL